MAKPSEHFEIITIETNESINEPINGPKKRKKDTTAARRMRLYRQRQRGEIIADTDGGDLFPLKRPRAMTGAERIRLYRLRKKLAKENLLKENEYVVLANRSTPSADTKVTNTETMGSGSQEVNKPTLLTYSASNRIVRATRRKKNHLSQEVDSKQTSTENDSRMLKDEEELGELDEHNSTEQELLDPLAQNNVIPCVNKQSTKKRTTFTMPYISPPKKKRANNQKIDAEVMQRNEAGTNIPHTQDAAALYGLLLAEKLRNLPTRTRLILQNKIDNLVFKTELTDHDRSSGALEIEVSDDTPVSSGRSKTHRGSSYRTQTPSPVSYIILSPSKLTTIDSENLPQGDDADTQSAVAEYYNNSQELLN